jgi:hypothetical protein
LQAGFWVSTRSPLRAFLALAQLRIYEFSNSRVSIRQFVTT